jgi:hypothetical protein
MKRKQYSFEAAHEYFFLSPCPKEQLPEELRKTGCRPTLHLLRRDLEHLYKPEREFYDVEADKHKAPFLACIGIMSGFDMLSKFYAPMKQKKQNNRKRFVTFATKIAKHNKRDANLMWDLRNALAHSYSLTLRGKNPGARITLTTGAQEGHWVTRTYRGGQRYLTVNFWELKSAFLKAITAYRDELLAPTRKTLRTRFTDYFNSDGYITVRKGK